MLNVAIATKFPPSDIKGMDNLVNKGEFISRSDLIREGTRKLIEEEKKRKTDKDDYVLEMGKGGVFKNPELRVLANILIGKKLTEKEKKIIKRISRRPLKPIKIIKGKMQLTEIGRDLAEGFLDSLLHLEKIV